MKFDKTYSFYNLANLLNCGFAFFMKILKLIFTANQLFNIIVVESGRKCMFFGSYQHTLDAKGRMTIPSRMKDQVGSQLFILKGYDGCISVYKEEDFLKKMQELQKLPFNQLDSRDCVRLELASVVDLEVDEVGRVLLPKKVLQSYKIGKKVMIVGVLDHFEIWDLAAWEKYSNEKDALYEQKANLLPKVE